jgi:hypothetical protein
VIDLLRAAERFAAQRSATTRINPTFLQGLISTAEQLTTTQRWERILLRIFERFIQPKLENTGLSALATG